MVELGVVVDPRNRIAVPFMVAVSSLIPNFIPCMIACDMLLYLPTMTLTIAWVTAKEEGGGGPHICNVPKNPSVVSGRS